VTSPAKKNFYSRCIFSIPTAERSEGNEMEPALGEMFNSVSKLLNVLSSLSERVTVDENFTTAQMLTDSGSPVGDSSNQTEKKYVRSFTSS
jgi:hypothetical protein